MKQSILALKSIAATLSITLFTTNVLWAHAPETNFWKERQKTVQLAGLPLSFPSHSSQILNGLPTLARPTASFSKRMAKEIPTGLEPALSPLIHALPPAYGTIRHISTPQGQKSTRTVIHIQDIHLNPEAQDNIGKAVQELINQKRVDMVALEGAFEPIDFSVYRKFPYQDSVKAAADYLFKEKKISGAVYTAFTSKADLPPFVGVDHPARYRANVEAYRTSAPLVKAQKSWLSKRERQLSQKQRRLYNKDLAEFETKVQAYRKGNLSWADYVRFLSERATGFSHDVSVFLEALDQETTLNFAKVERERSELITKLVSKLTKDETSLLFHVSLSYRIGNLQHADFYQYLKDTCQKNEIHLSQYKAMDAYIRYVLLADAINVEKVLQEIARMEETTYAVLARTPQEKKLVRFSKQLYLTGKLLDFALTKTEWEEYRKTVHRCPFGKRA